MRDSGVSMVPRRIFFVRHVRQPRLTVALARSLQKGIVLPENTHRPFRDLEPSCPDWPTLAAQLPVTPPPPPTTDVFSKASAYDRVNGLKLGRLMRELYGPGYGVLEKIKRALDPKNLMNPGKMGFEAFR